MTKQELAEALGEIIAYQTKIASGFKPGSHEYEAHKYAIAGMQIMARQLAEKAGINFDLIKACYYVAR